jgi:sugar lactone lactonase YvrE
MSVVVLAKNCALLGEGPHYSAAAEGSSSSGHLYYVDILGFKVCRYDAKTKLNKIIEV